MESEKEPWICVTTDHVETDLDWEAQTYKEEGVDYRQYQLRKAAPDELIDIASEADVLVVDQARITADVIAGLERCRLIIRHGDGYDNLDLDAATEAGIICANQPGFWSREVAEHAFTLGISLALRIPVQQDIARHARTGKNAGWDLHRAMPFGGLSSLTVGIIGCGRTGSLTAGLFGSVAFHVLACDPYIDKEKIRLAGAEAADLSEVIEESDLISLHVPPTGETVKMFDRKMISRMKKGALLVNTARGSIIDTTAVLEALDSGRLGGVALDSTDPEPLPPDHPLFSMSNVIITPHMGWYSEDALTNLRRSIVHDVLAARDGKAPFSVRNPEVLERPNLRLGR